MELVMFIRLQAWSTDRLDLPSFSAYNRAQHYLNSWLAAITQLTD